MRWATKTQVITMVIIVLWMFGSILMLMRLWEKDSTNEKEIEIWRKNQEMKIQELEGELEYFKRKLNKQLEEQTQPLNREISTIRGKMTELELMREELKEQNKNLMQAKYEILQLINHRGEVDKQIEGLEVKWKHLNNDTRKIQLEVKEIKTEMEKERVENSEKGKEKEKREEERKEEESEISQTKISQGGGEESEKEKKMRKISELFEEDQNFPNKDYGGNFSMKFDKYVQLIDNFNKNSKFRNAEKFELEENFIPITIRVFNRYEEFKEVINALRRVEEIEKTILVISHDSIDQRMFDLVDSIDFCQVVQLIHPYSSNILLDKFPGEDINLPDVNDQFGHKRPKIAAIKHHFWWLSNYVFARLFPDHQGDIAFIEEDHLMTDDYYRAIKAMREVRLVECDDVSCFGSIMNDDSNFSARSYQMADLTPNVGLQFDRISWNKVVDGAYFFCTIDEYNWDLTLTIMGAHNLIPRKSLSLNYSRVLHLGVCGSHQLAGDCNSARNIVYSSLKRKNDYLHSHPSLLDSYEIVKNSKAPRPIAMGGWGGWANPWDHRHCLEVLSHVGGVEFVNVDPLGH